MNFQPAAMPEKIILRSRRMRGRTFRKQASAAGYKLHRFNKNHYCFSAVLLDEETRNYIYISVGDVRYGRRWYEEVLYRTMAHEKDWTGSPNQFCAWDGISAALSGMKIGKAYSR